MQLFQITMDGAVSAENECDICALRDLAEPISFDTFAKGSETTLRHARLEDGGNVQGPQITAAIGKLSVKKLAFEL